MALYNKVMKNLHVAYIHSEHNPVDFFSHLPADSRYKQLETMFSAI